MDINFNYDIHEFELFKDNVKHHIKSSGELGFIKEVLLSGEIEDLWNEGNYLEALYIIATVDYLSERNEIPLYAKYNNMRKYKCENIIIPVSIIIEMNLTGKSLEELTDDAIPMYKKYNIIEGDIFNVA